MNRINATQFPGCAQVEWLGFNLPSATMIRREEFTSGSDSDYSKYVNSSISSESG